LKNTGIMENDKLNEPSELISDQYLKGVLKELLQGQSIKFHELIYERELLLERLHQSISKSCFELAKQIWTQVKRLFRLSDSRTPFVYFNQNKQWFELSQGTNKEDLQFDIEDDKLVYLDNDKSNDVIINPIFFQEGYNSLLGCEEFIRHQSARKLENYLLGKLQLV